MRLIFNKNFVKKTWLLNSDRIIRSDWVNCQPLTNTVLLILGTGLCQKKVENGTNYGPIARF